MSDMGSLPAASQPSVPSQTEASVGAAYLPQGYCPKPWIAKVNGKTLYDARGGARRYSTEKAALKAAAARAKGSEA